MRTTLGLLLTALVLGCGGDDGVTIDGDGGVDGTTKDGALVDGTGPNDGTPPGNDGAVPTDGAAPDGAGVDAGIPPNGTPPDPGKIACGNASCALPQTCCVTAVDGGATSTCGGGCAAVKLECDEAKDCPPEVLPDGGTAPQVCCYERAGNQITGSSCHRDCTGGSGLRTQACRTNAECLTGSCAVRSCTGTIKSVETCGPIANICP
jgi:hypothetical protein